MTSSWLHRNLLGYRFSDPAMEQRYRQFRLANSRGFVRLTMLVVLVALFVFVPIDFLRWGADQTVLALSSRIASTVAVALLLWRLPQLKDVRSFERWVFAIEMIVITHLLIISGLSHTEFSWNILGAFFVFSLIPLPLERQLISGAYLTFGSLITWFAVHFDSFATPSALSTPLALLVAFGCGIAYSLRRKRIGRREFRLLESEREARRTKDEALERLQAQTSAKERLFALISHDLRGPIGTMASIGELIASGDGEIDEAEKDRLLHALVRSAETTYDLLDNLLQWALYESNSLHPAPEDWELQPICEGCADFLASSARTKGVRLEIGCRPGLRVHADRRMIQTVIRNLLANSLKFTPAGGGIELAVRPGADNHIHLTVTDDGVGMSAERLADVLGDGPLAPTLGTNKEKGTGLGFRLCREFVRKNGGEFEVHSTPGEGTTVRFSIPAAR